MYEKEKEVNVRGMMNERIWTEEWVECSDTVGGLVTEYVSSVHILFQTKFNAHRMLCN